MKSTKSFDASQVVYALTDASNALFVAADRCHDIPAMANELRTIARALADRGYALRQLMHKASEHDQIENMHDDEFAKALKLP